jgi:hypothetical protein
MQYGFTLKLALPANHRPKHDLVERLGEYGCEDALVGIGQAGWIALPFTREADSAKSARTCRRQDHVRIWVQRFCSHEINVWRARGPSRRNL